MRKFNVDDYVKVVLPSKWNKSEYYNQVGRIQDLDYDRAAEKTVYFVEFDNEIAGTGFYAKDLVLAKDEESEILDKDDNCFVKSESAVDVIEDHLNEIRNSLIDIEAALDLLRGDDRQYENKK